MEERVRHRQPKGVETDGLPLDTTAPALDPTEDDLGMRQLAGDRVDVGAMHVGADGFDGGALADVERTVEEAFARGLRTIASKSDHLTAGEIAEHGPVALTTPALDLVGAEMTGATPWSRAVPVFEERFLCSPRLSG